MQQITLEEIRKHNKPDDLWLLIDNKVYDVTKYRLEHPGGEDVLEEVAGRDATKDFNDVGHSAEAREIMKKYCIGELAESDRKTNSAKYLGAIGAMMLGLIVVYVVKKVILSK